MVTGEVVTPKLSSCAPRNITTGLYQVWTKYGRPRLPPHSVTSWPSHRRSQSEQGPQVAGATQIQLSFVHHVVINAQLLKGMHSPPHPHLREGGPYPTPVCTQPFLQHPGTRREVQPQPFIDLIIGPRMT